MPPKKLSVEEAALVGTMVRRKLRFITLSKEHTEAARSRGPDVFSHALTEASKAFEPKTGREIIFPPRGTNMEEYYQKFESALTVKARTPTE